MKNFMKLSLTLIVAFLSVCHSTTTPSTSSASSYDVGCYAVYRSRTSGFSRFFPQNFPIPVCLEGGLWRHFQCVANPTFRCYCVYVDTGNFIPIYIPHQSHLVFYNPFYAQSVCPFREQLRSSTSNGTCENPPLSYPCNVRQAKYTFNAETRQCEETFGCYGFNSQSDCERKCNVQTPTTVAPTPTAPAPTAPVPEIQIFDSCSLHLDNGYSCPNRNESIRYRHDVTSGECQPFLYRGCGGNSNNYPSEWECERSCVSEVNASVLVRVDNETIHNITIPQWVVNRYELVDETNDISQEVFTEIGQYVTAVATIYEEIDPDSRSLALFDLDRDKTSQEEMIREALPSYLVCSMPAKTDPCRGYSPRWYYDLKRDKCFKFVYGGCQPNGNNFKTAHECSNYCNAGNIPSALELVQPPTDSEGNLIPDTSRQIRCEENARGELVCSFPGSTTPATTTMPPSRDEEEEV